MRWQPSNNVVVMLAMLCGCSCYMWLPMLCGCVVHLPLLCGSACCTAVLDVRLSLLLCGCDGCADVTALRL